MPDLTNIQLGDKVALYIRGGAMSSYPRVTHKIYTVVKRTATQALADSSGTQIRFRVSDGKLQGENYKNVILATPDLIAQVEQEEADLQRWYATSRRLDDLTEKALRELTLVQREALADAWERIKAMEVPDPITSYYTDRANGVHAAKAP